jgi:hypothetical protein
MRVLVVDAIPPEGLAYLRERNIQVDELAKPTLETLYARLGDYEGLITHSGPRSPASFWIMRRGSPS